MDFRKLLLIALAVLFAWQIAALTIDELQELYYQLEDLADFTPPAKLFITDNEDLDDLDEAFWTWYNAAPDSCRDWIEAKALEQSSHPKYSYLRVNLEEDPLAKLDHALALIGSHPDYAGGYRALLLTYVHDLYADEIEDPESSVHQHLLGDLPLIAHYGNTFPEDSYARLARIYHLLQSGQTEAAKIPFREALENEEAWIDDIGLDRMFTPDKYYPLLAYQIEVLRENDDDPYTKYRIAELAGDLVDYYYEQKQDHDAVIAYFGAEPWYWENQYVIYALTMSYLAKDQPEKAVDLLNGNGDLPAALQFQDSWLGFDQMQAAEAYARVLGPVSKDPLYAYLLARSLTDREEKLAQARALVASHPRVEHGYSLAAEIYLDFFSNLSTDDPDLAKMTASLRNDAQIMRNYYFRFPENQLAAVGYFLVNVMENDEAKAFRAYRELQEAGLGRFIDNDIVKFTLDSGQSGLLLRIKEYQVRQEEENSSLSETEIQKLASQAFCVTLYENNLYEELIAETAKHPGWMDDPEIQFLLVNAHYLSDDLTNTIATLRQMVEKGTIGTTMLIGIGDPNLTAHPDWQPLLDLAATLPDPDAGADEE